MCNKKLIKRFFVFYITAFELLAGLFPFITRTVGIGSQCINKESKDF